MVAEHAHRLGQHVEQRPAQQRTGRNRHQRQNHPPEYPLRQQQRHTSHQRQNAHGQPGQHDPPQHRHGGTGQPYVTADYAAVQRSLELSADALLVAKRGVDGVYDSDPKTHPDAQRYAHLTYREALERRVKVMDPTAFVLAEEQGLLMHIFDVAAAGAMSAICEGRDIGTRITAD